MNGLLPCHKTNRTKSFLLYDISRVSYRSLSFEIGTRSLTKAGLDLPPASISPKTFPLPQALSDRLRKISQHIHNGRGFCILRGLRPELFTDEENVLVFAGVSAHVAPRRGFQDVNRELITCECRPMSVKTAN